MPIVNNNGDVSIVYTIPSEIKNQIPDYFYIALAGELFSVFGFSAIAEDEDGFYGVGLISGTSGWGVAFDATCAKLDMEWLAEYRDALEWYDSDMFDGEVSGHVTNWLRSERDGHSSANAYYIKLIGHRKD